MVGKSVAEYKPLIDRISAKLVSLGRPADDVEYLWRAFNAIATIKVTKPACRHWMNGAAFPSQGKLAILESWLDDGFTSIKKAREPDEMVELPNFEKWARKVGLVIRKYGDGSYVDEETNDAFFAWMARARLDNS